AAIRDANAEAEITWVINPEWAPLLRGNRDINHVHIFPRGEFRGLGAPARLLPWIRETRRLRPDVALDFQGLFRSALIARISGASGPVHRPAAVATELVSVHRWTDPRRVWPYGAAATLSKNGKLFPRADPGAATDVRKGGKFLREDVGRIAELALRAVAKQPL